MKLGFHQNSIALTSVAFLFIIMNCSSTDNKAEVLHSENVIQEARIPLIYQMSFVQRYSEKLYLAGQAENWELADIYSHEIEEIAETIISERHVDDEVDISSLMKTMLIPQIERVEAAIDAKDLKFFEREYQILINTCNACHVVSNYGAVKLTVPQGNNYNQEFRP